MSFVYASPREFRDALLSCRYAMPYNRRPCLHVYELSEYRDMRTFLSRGKVAGYAIKPDGDLVSVFSKRRGMGSAIVEDAVWNGATKLDCFDGKLVELYTAYGFVEVRREPFDYSQCRPEWLGLHGLPDVVYMEYRG